MERDDLEYLELELPPYLREDIDALQEGRKKEVSYLDCLYAELMSSINIAFYDDVITEAQADYLRKKYLMQEI